MLPAALLCCAAVPRAQAMGQDCELLAEVTGWINAKATIPVWAKMTPNITDITQPALVAAEQGAGVPLARCWGRLPVVRMRMACRAGVLVHGLPPSSTPAPCSEPASPPPPKHTHTHTHTHTPPPPPPPPPPTHTTRL
jgi:hypothetical protein